MVNIYLAIVVFAVITLGIVKLTLKHYRQSNSEVMWKQYGMRSRYFQGAVIAGFIATYIIFTVLRWAGILVF